MKFGYFNKQGESITREEANDKLGDMAYTRVAYTTTLRHIISTVWLAIDHNFGDGEKILFETMVFKRKLWKRMGDTIHQERYSTEQEAIEAHKMLVRKYK